MRLIQYSMINSCLMVTGPPVVELIFVKCQGWLFTLEQTSNFILAWKKADIFKMNSGDDDGVFHHCQYIIKIKILLIYISVISIIFLSSHMLLLLIFLEFKPGIYQKRNWEQQMQSGDEGEIQQFVQTVGHRGMTNGAWKVFLDSKFIGILFICTSRWALEHRDWIFKFFFKLFFSF